MRQMTSPGSRRRNISWISVADSTCRTSTSMNATQGAVWQARMPTLTLGHCDHASMVSTSSGNSRQSGSSDHPALAHRPGAFPRPASTSAALSEASRTLGAASCGSSGSSPRQPWSCSRRASSPDEVTELQTYEPNSGTATTLTVYRRASGSVRKTLVDPVEHVAQSIAETAFAKTHEPRPLALTAQAPEVNGRHASYLCSLSFRDYPVTRGKEPQRILHDQDS